MWKPITKYKLNSVLTCYLCMSSDAHCLPIWLIQISSSVAIDVLQKQENNRHSGLHFLTCIFLKLLNIICKEHYTQKCVDSLTIARQSSPLPQLEAHIEITYTSHFTEVYFYNDYVKHWKKKYSYNLLK